MSYASNLLLIITVLLIHDLWSKQLPVTMNTSNAENTQLHTQSRIMPQVMAHEYNNTGKVA